jgi:hypothetical protein
MTALTRIHLDIDARVASIRENHADWLCGKGLRQLLPTPG